MQRLKKFEIRMLEAPDQQISLTDPDARSMATSGRGSGMVGYNVQTAADTKHHLIVAHEVTDIGTNRSQLHNMASLAKRGSIPTTCRWSPIVVTSPDHDPERMRTPAETVEHPFGTTKSWMGSTHFQMKTLPRVSTEMSLHVLAYNMKRLINLFGVEALLAKMQAA